MKDMFFPADVIVAFPTNPVVYICILSNGNTMKAAGESDYGPQRMKCLKCERYDIYRK